MVWRHIVEIAAQAPWRIRARARDSSSSSSSFARRRERVSVRLKNEAAGRGTLFFSQLVLPRVGAPRVTFVTKTAVKCMRPHSPGDSTPTEFLSHFSRSARRERERGPDSFPLPPLLVPGTAGIRAWHNAKYFSSFAAVKILTPLRGDTTPHRTRSTEIALHFARNKNGRGAGLDGRVGICSVARIAPSRYVLSRRIQRPIRALVRNSAAG